MEQREYHKTAGRQLYFKKLVAETKKNVLKSLRQDITHRRKWNSDADYRAYYAALGGWRRCGRGARPWGMPVGHDRGSAHEACP